MVTLATGSVPLTNLFLSFSPSSLSFSSRSSHPLILSLLLLFLTFRRVPTSTALCTHWGRSSHCSQRGPWERGRRCLFLIEILHSHGEGRGSKVERGREGREGRGGSYLCIELLTGVHLPFLQVTEGQSWWELQDGHDCHH